ncbi:MAG: type II secretion system protein [Candidatus Gracilibacteria bacterium]|jgi:prepilin-type N-terminal cleavage/methylation domain-containing protein
MKSARAFTLIELSIVIVIFAIVSAAVAVSTSRGILKARFDGELANVTAMIEKARAYSLNQLVVQDSEPAEYYLLTVNPTGLVLEAHGSTEEEEVESLILPEDFSLTTMGSAAIFYFPPDGTICFENENCTSALTEILIVLTENTGTYTQVIRMNAAGGYPEMVN